MNVEEAIMDESENAELDRREPDWEEAQKHHEQRDEIVGVGHVEPEYGYYCGMCKVQQRVAVLMSKEDLIKHGRSNKGLGHRLIGSMLDRYVACAIFEDRRIDNSLSDCEELFPSEIEQFNQKFSMAPPVVSPDLAQDGTWRLAGLAVTSTENSSTTTRLPVIPSTTTPRKRSLTKEDEAGVGEDEHTAQSYREVRRMKESFVVQAQAPDESAGTRSLESLCSDFEVQGYKSRKMQANGNKRQKSIPDSCPAPSSNPGTPASFADHFNAGCSSEPGPGAELLVNDQEEMFGFDNPVGYFGAGDVFADDGMDFHGHGFDAQK